MCSDVLCLDLTLINAHGRDVAGYECICILEAGHEGPHRDEFEHEGKLVVVTWDADTETED